MSNVANKMVQAAAGNAGSSEKTLALVSGASYFTVVDISDASNMSILGSIANSAFATTREGFADVDTNYKLFFASNSAGNVIVCNFSDPTNPTYSTTFNYSAGGITRSARSVVLDTSRKILFTNFNDHDAIYRSSYNTWGSRTSTDYVYSPSQLDNTWGMAIDTTNEILYSANRSDNSVTSLDYSPSSAMTFLVELTSLAAFPAPAGIAIDVDNSRVYATGEGQYHLAEINISNPSNMSFSRTYSAGSFSGGMGNPHSVVLDVEDEVALVYSRGNTAVVALDISSGTIHQLDSYYSSTYFDTAYNQIQVDTERKILFVICPGSGKGLTAIDYSDPTNLSLIGNISHASLRGRRLALA
jgi:hypothetical protein